MAGCTPKHGRLHAASPHRRIVSYCRIAGRVGERRCRWD
jgi:hypothetical protein